MGQPILPDLSFSKDAWNRNKTQAFDGNLEMILENTEWVNRILERTTWVRLYYLLKIAENFVKGQYESNRIVFYDFFAVPQF